MPKIIDHLDVLILEEAKNIVVREGVDAVNIRKIATACNLAVGTIYNYFPNKNAIMIRLMADYWSEFFEVMDELTSRSMDFSKKLEMLYQHFQAFIRNFHEFWLSSGSGQKTPVYTEDARRQKQEFVDILHQKMADMIRADFPVVVPGGLTYAELGQMIMNHFVALSYGGLCEYSVFDKAVNHLLRISCRTN